MVERIDAGDHEDGIDYYVELQSAAARLETWKELMARRYHLGAEDNLNMKSGVITRKATIGVTNGEDDRESGRASDSPRDQSSLKWQRQGDNLAERSGVPE